MITIDNNGKRMLYDSIVAWVDQNKKQKAPANGKSDAQNMTIFMAHVNDHVR